MAVDVSTRWERTERPSLERIGRLVLIANWTTHYVNESVNVETYYDVLTLEHFRQTTDETTCRWEKLDGGRVTVAPPSWFYQV